MKRRTLLRGALAAGLTAPAIAALTAARTDVDQPLSPGAPQDLADLEAAAESVSVSGGRLAGGVSCGDGNDVGIVRGTVHGTGFRAAQRPLSTP